MTISGLYGRFLDAVLQAPRRAFLLLCLACVPAFALTVSFFSHVEAGLQELLPKHAPTVRALEQIHARLGSQAHLTIIASSAEPETNRRFIATLGERLRSLNLPDARAFQVDVHSERKWLQSRAPLLLPAPEFDTLIGEVEGAFAASKAEANPLFVSLDDEAPSPEKRWAETRAKVEAQPAR